MIRLLSPFGLLGVSILPLTNGCGGTTLTKGKPVDQFTVIDNPLYPLFATSTITARHAGASINTPDDEYGIEFGPDEQ